MQKRKILTIAHFLPQNALRFAALILRQVALQRNNRSSCGVYWNEKKKKKKKNDRDHKAAWQNLLHRRSPCYEPDDKGNVISEAISDLKLN